MKHMNSSRREKLLLMLFPTALVLAIYSVFFAYPNQQKLRTLVRDFEQANQIAITEREATDSKNQLEATRQSLTRQKQRNQSSLLKIRELGHGWRNPDARLETLQQVTETMDQFNLSVVYQGFVDEPNLSTYFKNLTSMINREAVTQPLEYWEAEVEGTYPDMTLFLFEISKQNMHIVPVAISMKSPADSIAGNKNWKIIFLI
ncbi:MAG: hypothetical protein R3C03_07185 [Pirellulaceae bacterium]